MKTLQELLSEIEQLGDREAVLHRSGFRTRRWSYRKLSRHIQGAVEHFDEQSLERGDRVLLWGENRPEWVAVFWAAVARGLTVVPMDFRSSGTLVSRVGREVDAKLLVHGSAVDASTAPSLPRMSLEVIGELTSDRKLEVSRVEPSDVVQIIYTSGTTGAPKGVVHRHRNLVANLTPIRDEARKYAAFMRPFQPIRTLDLLPLSHVFGQFIGLFVPVVLGGSVAFIDEVHPAAIIDALRRERISVLSTVPRILSSLRDELERRFDIEATVAPGKGVSGGLRRWWRHRDVHTALGWKFWAVLSGGARLPEADEEFWYRVGLVLVQGYGMTETSSMVTTNHPLHPKKGSLGKVVGNQQIKLADDGEILVRGDNVSLEYWNQKQSSGRSEADASTWLHTGDLGGIRDDGDLYYKGRKKDVIVRADGLNVYPADVEAALVRRPEIRQAVVVGRASERGERVHGVLLMASGAPEDAVRAANAELEPHQRVQEWTVWPEDDFPRTESTFKVKRHEILERLAAPPTRSVPHVGHGARDVLARQLGRSRDELEGGDRLSDELGLTSLDRVELISDLERELGRELPEDELEKIDTVEQLEAWASRTPEMTKEPVRLSGLVRFGRIAPIRFVRALFREVVIRPLFRRYLPLSVSGGVEGVRPPVIFAANHQSNLDTLAVLTSLPHAWRGAIAPVVQREYFDAYLEKRGRMMERISAAVQYWLAIILVNVFPLPRSGASTRPTMRFAGSLVDDGYSILIFPEGRLSRDGSVGTFKPGVGLLAVRLGLPVVPIHLDGLFSILSFEDRWPKAGPVSVRIGEALHFHENESFDTATARIEAAVRELGRRSG